MTKHSPNFFVQLRPLDIEQYGLYTALILGYLNTADGYFNGGGRFYRTLHEIADTLGLSYDTVRKYVPTEEMGWKHYSGYKPGTMEKTTWWERVSPKYPLSESGSQPTSKESGSQPTSYYKEEYKEEERVRNGLSPISAPSPTTIFPGDGDKAEGDTDGGVVKITTVDLKAKRTADTAERQKRYALQRTLLDKMGAEKVKTGPQLDKVISARLRQGYTEMDLIEVATEAKVRKGEDEFFSVPKSVFSENGVSQLLTKGGKKKKDEKVDWRFAV